MYVAVHILFNYSVTMSQVYFTLSFFVLFLVQLVHGYPGDHVMLLPQFEMRSAESYPPQPYTSQIQANRYKPHQVLHTNVIQNKLPQAPMLERQSKPNMTFDEYLEALNEVSHHNEEYQQPRTAGTGGTAGRNDNSAYPTLPPPMGFPGSNYAPSATYHETPPVLTPSTAQPKMPLLKPDLSSLLTPVTTKVSGKLSGLLGLIFSLFSGSASGGMDMTGLKNVFIEGIIRPLLIAKGGIKALIAKLSIPVISLLLINLEVLITVWWLWEECPAKVEPVPSDTKPAAYNYNSYR